MTAAPRSPKDLLSKCNMCGGAIVTEDVKKNYYICPRCKGYFRVHARERIRRVADEGSFEEWDQDLTGGNPLDYPGYEEKLAATRLKTGLRGGCCHREMPRSADRRRYLASWTDASLWPAWERLWERKSPGQRNGPQGNACR